MIVDQLLQRDAVGCRSEVVAEPSHPQLEVDDLFGPRPRGEFGKDLVAITAVDRRHGSCDFGIDHLADELIVHGLRIGVGALASEHERQAGQDLFFSHRVGLEHRRRILGERPQHCGFEHQVVVAAFERRGRRKYHVGSLGGCRHVRIDDDQQVELFECVGDASRVRERPGRVAGQHDHRLDVASWVGDLLGQRCGRKLAFDLAEAARRALPTTELKTAAAGLRGSEQLGWRAVEHDAARLVEIAGECVEHVGRPARERAELGGVGAHATVRSGRVGGGELSSDAPGRVGVDAATVGDGFGRVVSDEPTDLVNAADVISQTPQVDKILVEQRVHEREQPPRVGAGTNR